MEHDIKFDTVEDALTDLRAGKMIVLVDDEDRENEGDFVMAAEFVTPEAITLMTRRASGIITVPMTAERLRELQLDLMVRENSESMSTAFTVTVDIRDGATTGSSAADRALTIRKLADPTARSQDFNRPGHVNPLMARKGGVLKRAGHTEAAVDMMRLAGLQPVGVICEIMGDDGDMARVPELRELAKQYDLKFITIADLIKYRRRTEKLIHKVAQAHLPTKYGEFEIHGYETDIEPTPYVVLTMGDISDGKDILVRIHSSCLTGDLLGSLKCDCGDQLHLALKKISEAGRGVLLYIEQEGRGIGIVNKIRAYALQDEGADTVEANVRLGFKPDLRDYGIGAQVLVDLGIKRILLLTNNPTKLAGLEGYDLEIVERIPLIAEANEASRRYMDTKRTKMGHLLDDPDGMDHIGS
ncbi:riboflavin biosynthesis protein RibBA [Capsulimonas corticalis]|uniref:Riboflavin biosynthesis protein RibBA n=1 Tax=Capsulimonas corticalis TaxID=2219043 RepID=A0A402CYS4_9BACT|nr:bifunctional 3,4-dihydroxy-2-butanone-4-phosphate synthase/GTP cyclohydrolase II [Capsulimonas corticalis]BDI31264.1 riboflavin biosynthesis protein RibBA [Capsulimonas corticalis]